MQKLFIKESKNLNGEVFIQGSKNSVLPILAATMLCSGSCIIHNCPKLSDVDATLEILKYLGANVDRNENDIFVDATGIYRCNIPRELMSKMRSSIIFLGPMLSRMGYANIYLPGGCDLGPRPIDIHLSALNKLGAKFENNNELLYCSLKKRFKGSTITLRLPSVGATENIILSAVLAKGETIIENAAQEPEIYDLCRFLNLCGAKIYSDREGTIRVLGVNKLHGIEYSVMPDRIVAATFMSAAAITGGDVIIKRVNIRHLKAVTEIFERMGCEVLLSQNDIRIIAKNKLVSVDFIKTMPYPGFPTDAQPLLMAPLAISQGTTIFYENIFKDRYKHVDEFLKMGANIKVEGEIAVVRGVDEVVGTDVTARDLRGAAALIVFSLAAKGETILDGLRHLDRGYENIVEELNGLGASIKRM